MNADTADAAATLQSGVEALRRGDAQRAREAFERLVAAGAADGDAFVGLAYACRILKDASGALAAADRALEKDPRHLRALILRADLLAEASDLRGASAYYLAALRAAPPANEVPAALRAELDRAQAMYQRCAAQFEGYLLQRLGGAQRAVPRFSESLDLLFGRKRIYLQQPRYYYFPGLPQIQFYDHSGFPWLDDVEAATGSIRDEFLDVVRDGAGIEPYVQATPDRPQGDELGMLGNPAWSAYYLMRNGAVVDEHAARCPKTMEALSRIPLARVPGRSPSVLFSILRPGAHIPPHNGFVNTRLIVHLPLVVPEGCALRVGNETRVPVEGKAWVFDDTVEHEAWNRSDRLRAILLFEIWKPELDDRERELVSAMFEAIDAYGGSKVAWEI